MKTLTSLFLLLLSFGVINTGVSFIGAKQSDASVSDWRQVLSQWYWIKSYDAWLEKDASRLVDELNVATALDPANFEYWQLAANKIAYDFPVWEIDLLKVEEASVMASIRKQYGRDALAYFGRSKSYFKENSKWYLTAGFLADRACDDQDLALTYFQEGVSLPEISYPLGVNYTRLLIEEGRSAEALSFLKTWFPSVLESRFSERKAEIGDWISRLEAKSTQPD